MGSIYGKVTRRDKNGWKRGEGPYSSSKDFKPDRPAMWGVTPARPGKSMGGSDISAKTDKAANVNGGFSGGIPASGKSGAPSWAGGKGRYYAR